VVAFNVSAELVYTNVLNLIDLADIPLHAADRGGGDPLVLAGGHCAFNPEPLADFVDAFVMGDGEEAVGDVTEVVSAWLASPPEGRARPDLLEALARAVAAAALAADPRITSVTVHLRKLRPPVAVDMADVGVRITRHR